MPYTQLDDGFHDHPETRALSDAAVGLFVKSLTFCAKYLTDGYVAPHFLESHVKGRAARKAMEDLLAAEPAWWTQDGKGVRIERFFDRTSPWGKQPSRVQVERGRERAAKRKEDYERRSAQGQLGWNAQAAGAGAKA